MILLNEIRPIRKFIGINFSSIFLAIFIFIIFSNNSVQAQCSGNFYDHAGSSSNYGVNRNDVTTFTATSGSKMKVQFTAFNTESGYDKLYVYDGANTSATLIFTLSGTSIPNDIISSGQSLTFKFVSDGSVTYSGWAATLSCITACSNITSAGTISGNETACGNSFDPSNIANVTSPSGGSGTLQYQWQSNTTGSWNNISGATSTSYDPSSITQTTQYRRGGRRSGCTDWLFSNIIMKTLTTCQEICDNGIDDDGDGFIDEYDPNCSCIAAGIPNIDFSKDTNGQPLSAGTVVFETWAAWGLHITTDAPSIRPPMIFNSSSPTGGDTDLGTPNTAFGGPGVGVGGGAGKLGENNTALGNLLIISTDGNSSNPNDHANGGTVTLTFDQDIDIASFELIDLDYGVTSGSIKLYDLNDTLVKEQVLYSLGNNSYQKVVLEGIGIRKIEIISFTSFSIASLNFCDNALPKANIGDLVWSDVNGDGLQTGEMGIPNVHVKLYDNSNNLLAETDTDNNGIYSFVNLPDGQYRVAIDAPAGSTPTNDLDTDNDNDSGVFTMLANETKLDVDFGLSGVVLPEICDNGIDDDGDGLIDCADPDCSNLIGGLDLGNLTSYLFFFSDGNGELNWQGATKGFVGDVAIDGVQANEKTSGSVPYAGTIYTNSNSLSNWATIVDDNDPGQVNPAQAFASLNQTSRISGLESNLTSAFSQINALTATTGYTSRSSSSLNGLNTQNSIAETFVINVTSGLTTSSTINITGDEDDYYILRWDTDGNPNNGYQGQVKFSGGGGIVPQGALKPSNFIHVAGDINSSGGGNTPSTPYPRGPRYLDGFGDLIVNGQNFSGGGYFTGYWLTTGNPSDSYKTASLSNAIFVGGWYSSSTQISMTSGTSGVYVSPKTNHIIGPKKICSGLSDSLKVLVGSSYLWSTGETTPLIEISPLVNTTYTVTVTDGGGCTEVLSQSVTVVNNCSGQICFNGNNDVSATSNWNISYNSDPSNERLKVRVTFSKNFADNTYGTNAIGWSGGHTFSNLVGSDHLVVSLLDGTNTEKMNLKLDYITADGTAPSGYRCLGVTGGDGSVNVGNVSDVLSVTTSLDVNMNQHGYVLTTNSPATNSNYDPNPTYPNWIYDMWYEVEVKLSAFGAAGFGNVAISSVHASPSKTGNNSEVVTEGACCQVFIDITGDKTICQSDTTTLMTNYTVESNVVLNATEDTYLSQEKPLENYGSCDDLYVGSKNSNRNRSIIKFDLSGIPPGANITSAKFYATKTGGDSDAATNIGIHRVTSAWTENTSGCGGSDKEPNWNKRSVTNNWSVAGGDFISTAESIKSVSTDAEYNWDIKNLLLGWLNNSYPNNGIMMKMQTEGSANEKYFGSSEAGTSTDRPYIKVFYSTVPNALDVSYNWSQGAGNTQSVNLSPASTTTYSVTISELGGCYGVDTVQVVVDPKPTASITGSSSICQGLTTTLSPTTGGSWTSSNPSVATVTSGGVVTGVSAGTATFTFTNTSTGCISNATSVVTIVGKPTVSITGSSTICQGLTTTLSPTTGGTWTSSNPSVATVTNGGVVTGVTAGTATFTFTNTSAGCVSNATSAVTIVGKPTVSITGSSTICQGLTTTLSPSTGGTWTSSNPSVATVTNGGVVTGVSSGTATFTFTNTSTGCISNATSAVTIVGKPTVSITGPSTICEGLTTTLSPTTGGTWTSSSPSIATVTNGGVVTGVTAGTATFTFTNTSTGCISNATTAVTIVGKPTVSITGSNTICTGESTTITASNAVSYLWSSNAGNATTNQVSVSPTTTTTYTVTVTNAEGCTATATKSITVTPTLSNTISNSGSDCYAAGKQLTASPTGGSGSYAYSWSGPNSFTATTNTITIPSNGSYSVTVTSGACSVVTSKLIYTQFTVDVTSVSSTVCEGTSVDLVANSANAASYLWSANAGNATSSVATVFPTPPSTAYGVTVTSNDGCTASATISINAIARPTLNLNGPDSICIGSTTQMDASAAGNWTALNPTIASINSAGVITGLSAGTAQFIFTQSSTNCQSDTSAAVEVNPKPTVQLIGPNSICKSSTTQLSPSSGGTWVSSDPSLATVTNQGLVTGVKAGTAYFTFTDMNTGCNSNPSTTVTIENGNGASISGPMALCVGSTGQLTASPHNGTWMSLNTSIATISNSGVVTAISEGVAQIKYNHNSGSCSVETVHTITVNDTPNVTFTSSNATCTTNNGSITMSFTNHPTRTQVKLSINDGVTYTTVSDAIGSYTFNNLALGTYKLHAKWSNDDCNVNIGQVVLIDSDPAPQTVITHADEACGTSTGGSISFAITDNPSRTQLNISLDGGATWPYTTADNIGTYTINNLAPATYSIATKWTDDSCSKVVGSVTILSGYANVGSISPSDTICYGASKTIVASEGNSYLWSTGSTNPSITVSPSGTQSYSVTISQTNGCSTTKSSTVLVVGQMNVSLNFVGGLCLTDTSKITAIHNGGLAPYTYTWGGPNGSAGTTKTITINEGGNYYVTVTDKIGCTATTSGFIYQKYEPFIVNLQTTVCEGTPVDLSVNASNAISYLWSPNAGSANTSFVTVTPTPPSSTYYVTVTNDIGCVAIANANINVHVAPTVSLNGDDEICVGATTQLSPSGNGYWASTNQSVAQVNNSGLVTGISAGNADFYYTETTNYCTSLNPIPITVLTDTIQGFVDNGMCIGDTLYLSPNTGGVWNAINTTAFTVSASGMVIAVAEGNGKFQFTPTGSVCKKTTVDEITVNPKPQPNIAGGSDICIGTTTYITPSSGGVWTSNNPNVASIDQYGTITGLAIGSATFTFVNDGTGCISDDSAPVNVSNNPIPIVYGPNAICVGTTTSLLPNTGGVWQSTNTSVASVTSNGIVNGIYPGEVRFIFVADGGLCISDTSDVVTVLNKPTITLNGDNSICIGETTSFSPSTGGTWTSSNPEVATINDSGVVTGVSAGMVNFAYQNATTTCISDPSTNITIYGNPVVTLTGADSICIGSLTTLSPTSGGVWTSSNNAIAIISSSGIVTGMSAGNATFTFKENQNNCTSGASTPITILPRPSVQITGPTEICQGSTTTLSPTSGGYWISNNTSVATVSESGVVTGVSQGIARFTFVSDFGCSSNQTAPILVNGKPNPVFMGTPSICIGSNINLLPNSGGTWTSSNPAIATINNSGVVSAVSAGVVTFTFTNTNTGCISNASGQLMVNGKPTISVLPGSRLCVGANMSVSPSVGGVWSSSNTNIATITNSGVVTSLSAGTVTFQFQNATTGCISDISNPVIVDAKPIISLNGPNPICVGDTTYMTPSTGGTWISNNPTVASINNSGVVIGQLGGVAKFRFTSAQNCASDLSNPIVINSSPTVGLLGPQFICIGSETNVFPSIGGYWTSSNPAIATITNSGLVTGHAEGVVYLTYTDAITGCKSNGNLQVNILAPPTLTLDGDSDICIGYTTKTTASSTGYWISSDTRIAIVTNDGVITGVAPGVVEFTFIDELTGCSNDGTGIMITVGKCLNPDFNVTLLNTLVNGDLSTNDLTPQNGLYNSFAILKSKPAGSIYTLNINADGTYNFSANKVGKYVFDIQVCIPPIDFGCPMSLLEITVIGDVNSSNIPVNNLEFVTTFANDNTSLAGDNVAFNSMSNDACVSGLGCNLGATNTSIVTPTTNGTNTYIGSGDFSYTPGIGHLGKDVMTYKVCSDIDPTNCSTSSTYITIASKTANNSVVAPDDFNYTLSGTPVSGNAKDNDTDPEGDILSVQPMGSVSSPINVNGGSYYIDANGDYTFTPNQYFNGPTSFVYTVCDDNVASVCMNATVHLIVIGDMTVSVKVYLEGALMNNGGNNSSGGNPLMRDNLRMSPFNGKNYIPLTDPYTTGTGLFAHGVKSHMGPGLLSVNQTIQDSASVFGVTGENAIVDWVFLDLRSKTDKTLCIATRSALLQRDGDVVELDGVSPVRFNGIGVDSFYIIVSHRNHLGVMSGLVSNSTTVDFTNQNTVTHNFGYYANNGFNYTGLTFNKNIKIGYNALWAGDFNSNGKVGFVGGDDDSNVIITDVLLFPDNVELKANYDFAYGYFNGDYDMNSKVKFTNPSDDTNMLFTQVLLYALNQTFASNFGAMIQQVPQRSN